MVSLFIRPFGHALYGAFARYDNSLFGFAGWSGNFGSSSFARHFRCNLTGLGDVLWNKVEFDDIPTLWAFDTHVPDKVLPDIEQPLPANGAIGLFIHKLTLLVVPVPLLV